MLETVCEFAMLTTVFPPRKFHTEQMFVLVSMQLRNRVDIQ